MTQHSVRTVLLALLAASVAASPRPRAPTTSWRQYVRSPSSTTVKPARIIEQNTTGSVQNPEGFIDGSGVTVFSRNTEDSEIPSVVVDFGKNVVGLLSIDFAGSHNISDGLPGIKLAFSETLEFLSNRSDYTRSDNAGGVRFLKISSSSLMLI
jgi:hypothetical protein